MNRVIFILPIVCLSLASAATVSYSYDAAGRLVKADYGASGSIAYTYDKGGNLISRTVEGASGGPSISSVRVVESIAIAGLAPQVRVELRGSNLAPTEPGGVSVSINGKPALVYSSCSVAASNLCASDRLFVLASLDAAAGEVPVVVMSGTISSAPYFANLKAALRSRGGTPPRP